MQNNYLSLTVGIPTYYGGMGLVKTAESILASKGVGKFRLLVTVDGNPLQSEVREKLLELGVDLIENKERGGQVARIKQMIGLCESDILVLTQDDISFRPDALAWIIKIFSKNSEVTMIGARMKPAPAEKFFESVVEVGVRLTHRIGDLWNKQDNYLLASGRCIGFRTAMAKKFVIPDEVINSDAYLYFEHKRQSGVFRSAPEAVVYNKSPQKIAEHVKQSKKFEYSRQELAHYWEGDLSKEYAIPKGIVARALVEEWLAHPVAATLYLLLQLYVKLRKNMFVDTQRFWSTDVSTKR